MYLYRIVFLSSFFLMLGNTSDTNKKQLLYKTTPTLLDAFMYDYTGVMHDLTLLHVH